MQNSKETASSFEHFDFEIVSKFGFRISDFS